MNISPNEIDTIEEAGMLDNSPVKMIKTKGGFWLAVGKPRGKMRDEALACGSHPAIVKFNVEKQFPAFQPALMKSAVFNDSAIVDKHSHFLSEELRKSGHDIYSVQDGSSIDFHVTKNNLKVETLEGHIENGSLKFNTVSMAKEFVKALSGATAEKAISCGVSAIKIENK